MDNMVKNKAATGRTKKQKREVKPIDNRTSRQVTFSKRRVGVFQKASELCVLTGAEVAVVCESVGGRLYAFGHPSVEHVVDKFIGDKNSSDQLSGYDSAATEEAHVNSSCMHEELKKQFLEISKELEIEKSKSENKNLVCDQLNKNKEEEEEGDFWWEQPFDHLEEEELEEYISSMETLMNKLKLRANDLRLIRTSSTLFDAGNSLNSNDTESLDEYLASKNMTTKDYAMTDEFFATTDMPKQDNGVPDHEFFANKDLITKGYGLTDEVFPKKDLANDLRLIRTASSSMFDASNTSNSNDTESLDEYIANKNMITKDYGMPDEFFATKDMPKQDNGVPDHEFFANKDLITTGYGLTDEFFPKKDLANDMRLIRTSSSIFDASNTSNSDVTESSDEYLANKNTTTKDYGLLDEFFATKNLPEQDNGVANEFFANKDLTTKGYGLTNEFFTNKDLTTKGSDLPDEFFANKNLTKQDSGVPDEFFTDKNLIKHGYGLSDEFFANKNPTMKGHGLPVEFSTNKKLNLIDDGFLNELLATNDPDFNDELDAFFTNFELPHDCGNNVQVPDIHGNQSCGS